MRQNHRPDGGRDQQRAGQLERPDVLDEDQFGQAFYVSGGVGRVESGEIESPGAGRVAQQHPDDQQPEADSDDDGRDTVPAQCLGQRLRGVDPDEHQDEQKQHHDRAGVDDDLHYTEKQGPLGHVEGSENDHGGREEQCRVDGLRAHHHTQCTDDRNDTEGPELHGLAGGGCLERELNGGSHRTGPRSVSASLSAPVTAPR